MTMSNTYSFARECSGEGGYDYGRLEETINLVFDNYYLSLDMYRTIVRIIKDVEEVKLKAHQDLQKLRDDEARWKRLDSLPKGFDADEHQKRKDYLVELRESKFDIFYKGILVEQDPLGNLILRNMRVFKVIEACDRKVRGFVGKSAKNVVKVMTWPTLKLINIDLRMSKNKKYKNTMTTVKENLKEAPEKVEKVFTNF